MAINSRPRDAPLKRGIRACPLVVHPRGEGFLGSADCPRLETERASLRWIGGFLLTQKEL